MKHSFVLTLGVVAVALGSRAAETLVPAAMFTVPEGLEVTVWAQSPMLRNPTNLDFVQDGRIWVAEGVNYRRHYNRQPEGDRIVILEDTDRDGRADRESVFVQEPFLRAPMGIAVLDNRIVVSMAPDLIVYTDVNRDRKFDPAVDRREVLLSGFNGRIHDHTIHSVTAGPDGQWYWNAGNCGAVFTDKSGKTFRIGSAYDPNYGRGKADIGWDPREIGGQASDDGHVYVGGFAARMNPDASGVKVIGHNFRNSYEQTVTSFGDVFQNDNDDPPACRTAFLPECGNAGFCSFDGKRSWGADRRPGQSVPVAQWRQEDPGTMPAGDVYGGGSPTGIAYYEDGALGKKWRGLLLSCEPGRNVVFGYFPKPEGAGFKLERFDFLTSNTEGKFAGGDFKGGDKSVSKELKTLFRPADVGVGPDGAVYVADWFDPRVGGHNDMDETLSGAIYRIAPKGFRPSVPKYDLSRVDGQVAALRSPAVNVRNSGFTRLVASGESSVKPVARLLNDENPYVRARAVWILSQLGPKGIDRIKPLLRNKDEALRTVAFRALRRVGHDFLNTAKTMATDASPAVRREVALSLRDVPFEQSSEILKTLALNMDAADRAALDAWGTGCTGKESPMYSLLLTSWGQNDPTTWLPANARILWRLHPPESLPAFRLRALSPRLSEADRRAALTVIGYDPSAAAARAMLEVAQEKGPLRTEAIWWLLNRKDSTWKNHGLAAELKRTGVYDPDQVELTSATIPEPGLVGLPAHSEIARMNGDVTRGAEKAKICFTCHRIGDSGTEYAPNLTGWARRQTTEVVIQSIVDPSADIAHGFDGTAVITTDGTEIHGLVVSNGDPLVIQSAAGVTQTVPANRIKSRKPLGRSLMMNAEQLGLTAADVADIAAFLKTR